LLQIHNICWQKTKQMHRVHVFNAKRWDVLSLTSTMKAEARLWDHTGADKNDSWAVSLLLHFCLYLSFYQCIETETF
jgi:hypothetical protein